MKGQIRHHQYIALAALLALTLFAGAFSGCAVPGAQAPQESGAGHPPSENTGLFDTGASAAPAAGPAPGAVQGASQTAGSGAGDTPGEDPESYTPGPQPGFEGLPQSACFVLPGIHGSEGPLLRGGLPVGGSYWVTDISTGRAAAVGERRFVQGETLHALYDLDGSLLLELRDGMWPTRAVGGWVFLVKGFADFEDGQAVSLNTGEVRFRHYNLVGRAGNDLYALSANGSTRQPLAPLLVNGALAVVRQFDGYSSAWYGVAGRQQLPGYLVLSANDNGYYYQSLYSVALDEIFRGEFLGFVEGEAPMGLFRAEEGVAIYDLVTSERLTPPENEGFCRHYLIYTPQVKGYTLYDAAGNDFCGNYLEIAPADQVISCRGMGCLPSGFYAIKSDGSVLILDDAGRLAETLPARKQAALSPIGYPRPRLLLYAGGGEWRLYNRGGVCAEGQADFADLTDLSENRYSLRLLQGEVSLYSLLDGEGTFLLSGLNQLYATGLPGVWAVQKGASTGLMDETGRWLWRQSILTNASKKEEYPW